MQVDVVLVPADAASLADLLVIAAQDRVAAVDDRHLAAKFVEDAGELVGDIAAACDDDPVRQGIEVKNLVRGDRMLAARKIGNKGPAAGRDQYAIGGQFLPVGQEIGRAHV